MNSLKNKLLVAMPNMTDPYFAESVVLLCEDSDCLLYTSPSPRD